MRYGELARKLRRLGIILDRQGTRHEVWVNPRTDREAMVPRHRTGEIPTGTLRKIVRDLDVDWDEFRQA